MKRLKRLINCIRGCFKKRHETHSFASGELVFQVQHAEQTEADTRASIVQALQIFLKSDRVSASLETAKYKPRLDSDWRKMLIPPSEDDALIITFSAGLVKEMEEPFSLVSIQLKSNEEQDVLSVLHDAVLELGNGPIRMENGVSLLSISPNWLASGLHHGGSTGGPGSWPHEVPAPADNQHGFRFDSASVRSLAPHKAKLSSGQIHVAILDTIPTADLSLRARQSVLPALGNVSTPEVLIRYLFDGSLDIRPASPAISVSLTSLESLTPPPDHYPMPDHGTFVAGVIRTIAPNATLHLYQVLNQFGVGTLTSVSQGLQDAVNTWSKDNNSLIVNCSFMIDDNIPGLVDALEDPATMQILTKSVRDVFQWATNRRNVLVVAAAGNDATAKGRPYARYPAAFQGVLGVGALPKGNPRNAAGGYIPASYSNFSYSTGEGKSPRDGLMVFGGEFDQPFSSILHSASQGVLGVYLGNIPQPDSVGAVASLSPGNTNWARWAGTSFSAPMISGWLAGTFPAPTGATPSSFETAEGEKVIIVQ